MELLATQSVAVAKVTVNLVGQEQSKLWSGVQNSLANLSLL